MVWKQQSKVLIWKFTHFWRTLVTRQFNPAANSGFDCALGDRGARTTDHQCTDISPRKERRRRQEVFNPSTRLKTACSRRASQCECHKRTVKTRVPVVGHFVGFLWLESCFGKRVEWMFRSDVTRNSRVWHFSEVLQGEEPLGVSPTHVYNLHIHFISHQKDPRKEKKNKKDFLQFLWKLCENSEAQMCREACVLLLAWK